MRTINQQLSYWRNTLATSNDHLAHRTARLIIVALLDERTLEYKTRTMED